MTNVSRVRDMPPDLGGLPKHFNDRMVRIESKLTNYMKGEEEEHMLNGQMRVRVCHIERELAQLKSMVFDLTVAFKEFKREWDEEAEHDDSY